jgi:DNA polymerase III sliding clamp (beta) subunit (PCNA family)
MVTEIRSPFDIPLKDGEIRLRDGRPWMPPSEPEIPAPKVQTKKMVFEVKAAQILEPLRVAMAVRTERKSVPPIERSVLLRAKDKAVEVLAVNGRTGSIGAAKAISVSKAGAICVDPADLISFVDTAAKSGSTLKFMSMTRHETGATPQKIHEEHGYAISSMYDTKERFRWALKAYEKSEAELKVTTDGVTMTYDALHPKQFPFTGIKPKEKGMAFTIKGVLKLLKQLEWSRASGQQETRPCLKGVYLKPVSKSKICARTTDGRALTMVNMSGKLGRSLLLDEALLKLLNRVKPAGDLKITVHKGDILVLTVGKVEIVTDAAQHTYPDLKQIIPEKGKGHKLTVVTKELARYVETLCPGKHDKVLRLQTKRGMLNLWTTGDNLKRREAKMPAEGRIAVGLDPRYLKEALARLGPKAVIKSTKVGSPIRIDEGDMTIVLASVFVNDLK